MSDWLSRETEAWERDGLITADQRQAILARYRSSGDTQAGAILRWLAILAAGVGAVTLVAWNWDAMPRPAQLGLVFGATAAAFAAAVVFDGRRRPAAADRAILLAALLMCGVLVAIQDGYQVATWRLSAIWAVPLAVTAALVPSPWTTTIGALVLGTWVLQQAGGPPPPWLFALCWPLLAWAVEVRPNRVAAAAVSFVFAVWAAIVALDVWAAESGTAAVVMLLLAGAALDAWAHAPAGRRPAFAWPSHAMVVVLLALLILQPGLGTSRYAGDWTHAADSPVPALLLAFTLVAAAVWPAVRRVPGTGRAAGLALIGAAWLGGWILLPATVRGAEAFAWGWPLAFGLAAIGAGVSLVREGARRRAPALFVLGLLHVLGFVAVRAFDARGSLVETSLVLFLGAGVLWWLARSWQQAGAGGGRS